MPVTVIPLERNAAVIDRNMIPELVWSHKCMPAPVILFLPNLFYHEHEQQVARARGGEGREGGYIQTGTGGDEQTELGKDRRGAKEVEC